MSRPMFHCVCNFTQDLPGNFAMPLPGGLLSFPVRMESDGQSEGVRCHGFILSRVSRMIRCQTGDMFPPAFQRQTWRGEVPNAAAVFAMDPQRAKRDGKSSCDSSPSISSLLPGKPAGHP